MSPLTEPTRLTLRKSWQPMDADAAAYITAVEAADTAAGQSGGLEEKTKIAIDNFVLGCKADGIWNAIQESCILAGARTTNGALIPLKGTAPTPYNFDLATDTDYNRKAGLAGNGTTKYLTTATLVSGLAAGNSHAGIHCTLLGNKSFLGNTTVPRFDWYEVGGTATLRHLYGGGGGGGIPSPISTTGFVGTVRTSISTTYVARANGNNYSITSGFPGLGAAEPLWIFRSPSAGYSTARLAFYSIGESLNLALLDARVTDLITAIGAAIP